MDFSLENLFIILFLMSVVQSNLEKKATRNDCNKLEQDKSLKKPTPSLPEKIVPLLMVPFLLSSAVIPLMIIVIKVLFIKSIIVALINLSLIGLNFFRRANGEFHNNNKNFNYMTNLVEEHYGYHGIVEPGVYIN